MNLGDFNKKLILQKYKPTPNETGGTWDKWEPEGFIWGKVTELEPIEFEETGKDRRLARYEVIIRKTEITVKDRLLLDGRTLEIDYINDSDSKPPFYLKLTCLELRVN